MNELEKQFEKETGLKSRYEFFASEEYVQWLEEKIEKAKAMAIQSKVKGNDEMNCVIDRIVSNL